MSRFLSLLAAAGVLVASASDALADRALVIGAPEEERRGLLRGSGTPDVAQALRDSGFTVITADAGSVEAMRSALSEFMDGLGDESRAVVHLSGQFVRGAGQAWLLEDGAERSDLATVGNVGLSLDGVLTIAGRVPGAAVVALGVEEGGASPGDGLRSGVAFTAIPQGVTLARGAPEDVARFVASELLEEGRSIPDAIDAAREITGRGFLSRQSAFLPLGEERPIAPPDAAEVERAIWQATRAQDTVAGYRGYLKRYPDGFFADDAKKAIDAIQTEPNRVARQSEEALELSRSARREIQQQLTLLGYQPRGVDGIFGSGTRAAITRFQEKAGFPDTGYLDARQIERLSLLAERRQAELEADAARVALEREKRDREAWATLGKGDEADLRTYLERYPDGLFVAIAKQRLSVIEAENRAAEEALDRADWDRAAAAGTVSAYRAYLKAHPKGSFAGEARERLDALGTAESEAVVAARAAEAQLGLNAVTRMLVERQLDEMGHKPGAVDGTFDDQTRSAIRRFQRQHGMSVTGYMSTDVVARMLADFSGLLSPGR
ncbi:putative peptidoglycan binding protein [Aliiruegeria haliotis]|uniref:Putative peptidoglycan binding protein n=1 Tax=Aliiruegeria haliotis TaxID=1280846 RepID=A0A2T0RST1_9RHOB|nr:peptidoglycan-binding protein [Aliiruegeria haliotis]PRY24259.1 putative peptidoglycan binding protein [Aliiruegeria haliotis]